MKYQGENRRKRVRKTDIAEKIYKIVNSALATIILGLILWVVTDIFQGQQRSLINDEVMKEHQINTEKNSKAIHDRHELKLEALDHNMNNIDKRVYKLENYAN